MFTQDPGKEMLQILQAVIFLLSRPDNDFTWSSWGNQQNAIEYVSAIIDELRSGHISDFTKLAVLFAPTGPIQEVSINSGWIEEFMQLAVIFDRIKYTLQYS